MPIRAMQSLVGFWKSPRRELTHRRIVRRCAQSSDYNFTEDYSSWLAPTWKKHLSEFRGKSNVHFLEIGCFEGRSSIWFLENILTHPSATLTCVDSFARRGGEPRFDHNLRVSGCGDKMTKIKAKSEDVLPTFEPETFDGIYIDGCHLAMNVMMDAVSSWILLKRGGVLLFDDYAWHPDAPPMERPQLAIDLFLQAFRTQLQILHKQWQVIVKKLA